MDRVFEHVEPVSEYAGRRSHAGAILRGFCAAVLVLVLLVASLDHRTGEWRPWSIITANNVTLGAMIIGVAIIVTGLLVCSLLLIRAQGRSIETAGDEIVAAEMQVRRGLNHAARIKALLGDS